MYECRVCLEDGTEDGELPLISPCGCRGTIGHVHAECLRLTCRAKSNYFECLLCQQPYMENALDGILLDKEILGLNVSGASWYVRLLRGDRLRTLLSVAAQFCEFVTLDVIDTHEFQGVAFGWVGETRVDLIEGRLAAQICVRRGPKPRICLELRPLLQSLTVREMCQHAVLQMYGSKNLHSIHFQLYSPSLSNWHGFSAEVLSNLAPYKRPFFGWDLPSSPHHRSVHIGVQSFRDILDAASSHGAPTMTLMIYESKTSTDGELLVMPSSLVFVVRYVTEEVSVVFPYRTSAMRNGAEYELRETTSPVQNEDYEEERLERCYSGTFCTTRLGKFVNKLDDGMLALDLRSASPLAAHGFCAGGKLTYILAPNSFG